MEIYKNFKHHISIESLKKLDFIYFKISKAALTRLNKWSTDRYDNNQKTLLEF